MNKEITLIPEVRFPEFINDGDWEKSTIGEIGSFYYGKSAPKWSLSDDALTPCVRYGELYTKFGAIISKIYSHTNVDSNNLRFSKGGEILIPRVGEIPQDFAKNVCFLPFPNIAIGEMISVFETAEHPIFYTYYFRTLIKQFSEVVEGQNVKNLYYINLKPISIGKPSYIEQKKIADCLSSLDDVIEANDIKLKLLNDHKKGLLQNLFPKEGKTVPEFRFPEFKSDKEWILKPLKEVFRIFQGFAFSSDDSVQAGTRWLKIADVGIQQMKSDTESFLPKDFVSIYEKFLVKKGEYVLALTRPILNGKLKIAKVDDVYHNSLLNQRVGKIVTSNSRSFIYYLLQTYSMIDLISRNIAGNEPPNLSFQQIENSLILVPEKIIEQEKIASCIASLDELILEQSKRIEQLGQYKKGLMQSLFPKMND
ncbi:restriction endonuclease subunit S [Sphingobacterium multivorum]|uniref:restriction endonuclease subunit S n=1 Tax=Sphingobacterium multivorum TaxID=28454 RepID=UPI003DA217E1